MLNRRLRSIIAMLAACLLLTHVFTLPARAEVPAGTDSTSTAALDLDELLHDLLDYIETSHVSPPDRDDLLRAAIRGMFDGLGDPYSAFLSKSEMASLESVITGEFGGVGVRVELIAGIVTVTAPIPGTPAAEAGIRAGDQIVAVDGVSCLGMGLSETSSLIKGEPGTSVTLTIVRGQEQLTYTLVRAMIRLQNVESKILNGTTGYIRISEFSEGVSREFAQIVGEWQSGGQIDAVILDLRNNPGGLLTEAVQMITELSPLDAGAAMWVRTRDASFPITYTQRTIAVPEFKLIVLVNGGSASASEIVAGAIKDLGAGTLLGTTTFGKGTVQEVYALPTGEGFKLTVAEYLTPLFGSVNGIGVTPDVIVAEPGIVRHEVSSTRDMQAGQIGLDVLGLEEGLALLGFAPGQVDGIFDEATKSAVARLQLDNDMETTGIAGSETVRVINYCLSEYDRNQAMVDVQLDKAIELLDEWRAEPR